MSVLATTSALPSCFVRTGDGAFLEWRHLPARGRGRWVEWESVLVEPKKTST